MFVPSNYEMFNNINNIINDNSKSKKEIKALVKNKFNLEVNGALLYNNEFSICFTEAKVENCSNTVIAFKTIVAYDEKPILCCLTTSKNSQLFLINTSFINKVSHSSKNLCLEKYVGSINFSDISRSCFGLPNNITNFIELFSWHKERNKQEIINKIIENTQNIKPSIHKKVFTLEEQNNILSYPSREYTCLSSTEYKDLLYNIGNKIKEINLKKDNLKDIFSIESEKCRGDAIESLFTGVSTDHSFSDVTYNLSNNININIDIKSVVLNKESNPKGYDITKLLTCISNRNNIYLILILGCNTTSNKIESFCLESIFSNALEGNIQKAWSGRDSRGTIQFNGIKLKNKLLSTNTNISITNLEFNKQKLNNFICL